MTNNNVVDDVKLIAFHLPQFHTFPENDNWWGQGFTEWTNTRKSAPQFPDHYQPREPLNDNYYDLSKKDAIEWQMDLAKKYGLYGFCYYHYWFDGKLLMEKPIELMRKIKNRIPYCFCWANEPWTRAWDGKSKEVLIDQCYGTQKEWKAHFNYLHRFFTDDLYIKIDGAPIFLLYKTSSLNNCDDMIKYWDHLCKKLGFSGIHVIEEKNAFQKKKISKESKAVLEFEPMYTVKYGRGIILRISDKIRAKVFNQTFKNNILIYNYDKIWRAILKRKKTIKEKCYLGAFVDWDNSARKNKNSLLFYGATPEKFGKYLNFQITEAKKMKSEFIFINAWNEWAEGTYLEPDKKWNYGYLDAIKNALLKNKNLAKHDDENNVRITP